MLQQPGVINLAHNDCSQINPVMLSLRTNLQSLVLASSPWQHHWINLPYIKWLARLDCVSLDSLRSFTSYAQRRFWAGLFNDDAVMQ